MPCRPGLWAKAWRGPVAVQEGPLENSLQSAALPQWIRWPPWMISGSNLRPIAAVGLGVGCLQATWGQRIHSGGKDGPVGNPRGSRWHSADRSIDPLRRDFRRAGCLNINCRSQGRPMHTSGSFGRVIASHLSPDNRCYRKELLSRSFAHCTLLR